MHHRSLGLSELTRNMLKSGDCILDLGPSTCGTTQSFLDLNCQCFIEDMIDYFHLLENGDDPIDALNRHLLPKPESIKFDIVLCWDILNFLSPDTLHYLIEKLSPNLKPGTIIHMMRYTGSQPPAKPQRFQMLEDFHFECSEDHTYPNAQAHRYTTIALMGSMPGFTLFHSVMQRQGMSNNVTEHFMEYQSSASAKTLRASSNAQHATYFTNTDSVITAQFPALNKVLNNTLSKPVLLDVGQRSNRQLEHLKNISQQLFVEDLHASLSWHTRVKRDANTAFAGAMLQYDAAVKFDVVFLWDFLSYCTSDQVRVLMQKLSALMVVGGVVHFVQLKTPGLPERPIVYDILNQTEVSLRGCLSGEDRKLDLSVIELFALMPDFQLQDNQAGVLSTGDAFHEYVLRYIP